MEINLNSNIESLGRIAGSQPKRLETKTESGATAFGQSEALNQALQQTPNVRPEVVATAQSAVNSSHYPPAETIKQIATLLALHMNQDN